MSMEQHEVKIRSYNCISDFLFCLFVCLFVCCIRFEFDECFEPEDQLGKYTNICRNPAVRCDLDWKGNTF